MSEKRNRPLVLFADDEVVLHQLMCGILRTHGYEVECVENGEDALESFRKRNHDALVVDLMMPRMNGFEFLREIKAIDQKALHRTIVLTGTCRDTWQWFERDSVGASLTKPVDVNLLLDELSRCASNQPEKKEKWRFRA